MNNLDNIIKAAREHKLVIIRYSKKDGTSSTRTIEPYSMKDDKLYAYCTNSHGIRAFFLSKINSAEITNRIFAPRWPIEL